jgi:hypothetical protein
MIRKKIPVRKQRSYRQPPLVKILERSKILLETSSASNKLRFGFSLIKSMKRQEGSYKFYLEGDVVRDYLLKTDFATRVDILTDAPFGVIKRILGDNYRIVDGVLCYETDVELLSVPVAIKSLPQNFKKDQVVPKITLAGFNCEQVYITPEGYVVTSLCGAIKSLQEKNLTSYYSSEQLFQPDPLRILRLIYFVGKYQLRVLPDMVAAARYYAHMLKGFLYTKQMYSELANLFSQGFAKRSVALLHEYGVVEAIFPVLHNFLIDSEGGFFQSWFYWQLEKFDEMLPENRSVEFVFSLCMCCEILSVPFDFPLTWEEGAARERIGKWVGSQRIFREFDVDRMTHEVIARVASYYKHCNNSICSCPQEQITEPVIQRRYSM